MGNVGGLVGAFVGRGVVGGAPELTEYSIIPLNTRGEKLPHHSHPAPFPSKNAMSAFELYREHLLLQCQECTLHLRESGKFRHG